MTHRNGRGAPYTWWALVSGLLFASVVRGRSVSTDAAPAAAPCRCFPGDACWPDEKAWAELNSTVDGRLIATVPLASVCHGTNTYSEKGCADLRAAWPNPDTHIDSTSSVMAPFYANESCSPFSAREAPCVVGAYVQYAVDATHPSHYQKTLAFAAEHNIRLVVRNTAHDWLGKSTGAGGLAIRTHNYKGVEVLDYESEHYTGKALKMFAGTQFRDAFQAAHDQGLVVVGGTCPSVGIAGGYTQGGGHGLTVSALGLGADQVLEWEVVTADGEIVKASPKTNPDLYWALSGGGGGTFGVVIALTVKAHQDRITAGANLTWTNEGITQDKYYEAIRLYISSLPPLLDAGATSTWLNNNATFSVSPAVGFGMSKEDLDALHQPLLDELDKLEIKYTYYSADFPTFLDFYHDMNPFTETATFQLGSRLIPRKVVLNAAEDFAHTLQEITDEHDGAWISGVSFNVSRAPDVPNAVNPAFRDASVSLVVGTLYDYYKTENNAALQQLMTDVFVPKLAALIDGGGSAYLNEGDPNEQEWQKVFYGENYQRLLEIKNRYDPDRVFYGRTAVGSEAWAESKDGRLCRKDRD
ncbi:FAD binding domain-containing protein [Apiospora marii]|uniref:FAD binding domain-containing protein n=1 Tax=Apiospora marii TaxID=335849 RepID=UPI00312EE1FD